MRTTLTLDDDLAEALKERARRDGLSFKEVVNAAIRRGLAAGERPAAARERFRVQARPRGFRAGVDLRRLNQLVDELSLRDGLPGLGDGEARDRDGASQVHEPRERSGRE